MPLETKSPFILKILDQSVWLLLIIIYLLFACLKPTALFKISTLSTMLFSTVPLGILALAQALVLMSGKFDLSIGQIAGLSAAAGAVIASGGTYPEWIYILVPLLVGATCGAINATLSAILGLNAFLVTLATFLVFDGLQLLVSDQVVITLPEAYLYLGGNHWAAISMLILAIFIAHFWLAKMRSGLRFRSVGSSAETSLQLGIWVKGYQSLAFILAGTLAGLAGLLFTGYSSAYSPDVGEDTIFMAFAAAVISGISLDGGKGKMLNLLGGILILSIINTGLTALAVEPYLRRTTFGIVVVMAIIADHYTKILRKKLST